MVVRKKSNEQRFCKRKCFVDKRGQGIARLVSADRKHAVNQILSLSNPAGLKSKKAAMGTEFLQNWTVKA